MGVLGCVRLAAWLPWKDRGVNVRSSSSRCTPAVLIAVACGSEAALTNRCRFRPRTGRKTVRLPVQGDDNALRGGGRSSSISEDRAKGKRTAWLCCASLQWHCWRCPASCLHSFTLLPQSCTVHHISIYKLCRAIVYNPTP